MPSLNRTVLYVDDEPNNLVVFEAAFEDDFQVLTATSGRVALEVLRTHEVAVLITDQRMPEMTGVQLLEAIIPEFPDVVRMILTGYTDVDSIVRAINNGRVYQYLTKPWEEKHVRVVIERAIERYDGVRQEHVLVAKLAEQVERERTIRGLFRGYVPVQVVDEVMSGDRPSGQRGEPRIVAMLAVDIRAFTSLVAESQPGDVISFVNTWFGLLSEIVEGRGGSVNQLLGDGLFAVFGAPLSTLDNDANAVFAARDISRFVARFNRERPPGWPGREIHVGIAVHRGECAVGSIGSDTKLEYAVVGEPVYRLHDLEEFARAWNDTVLVSEEIRHWTRDRFVYEPVAPGVWRLGGGDG